MFLIQYSSCRLVSKIQGTCTQQYIIGWLHFKASVSRRPSLKLRHGQKPSSNNWTLTAVMRRGTISSKSLKMDQVSNLHSVRAEVLKIN